MKTNIFVLWHNLWKWNWKFNIHRDKIRARTDLPKILLITMYMYEKQWKWRVAFLIFNLITKFYKSVVIVVMTDILWQVDDDWEKWWWWPEAEDLCRFLDRQVLVLKLIRVVIFWCHVRPINSQFVLRFLILVVNIYHEMLLMFQVPSKQYEKRFQWTISKFKKR